MRFSVCVAPKTLRQLELRRHRVDGDDHRRAGDRAALDRVQADAAGAEHHDRRARLDLGGVEHRARRRSSRRSRQRAAWSSGTVSSDLDHAGLVQRRVLGHHAGAGEVRLSGCPCASLVRSCAVRQRERPPVLPTSQSCGRPVHAVAAIAAGGDETEMITWSPTLRSVTPSPTSATTPAASWPSTIGGGSGKVPLVADRSLWQTPQAAIFTSPRSVRRLDGDVSTRRWIRRRETRRPWHGSAYASRQWQKWMTIPLCRAAWRLPAC